MAQLPSPIEIVQETLNRKGSCHVFEIGPGFGIALEQLAIEPRLRNERNKTRLSGLDVFSGAQFPKRIGKISVGNALRKPFPKSDLVFSLYSLGYIGNVGFILRKTANALNPNGVGVLHVNEVSAIPNVPLIKSLGRLAENLRKIRISGCTIRVFTNLASPGFFESTPLQALNENDVVIIIEKQ